MDLFQLFIDGLALLEVTWTLTDELLKYWRATKRKDRDTETTIQNKDNEEEETTLDDETRRRSPNHREHRAGELIELTQSNNDVVCSEDLSQKVLGEDTISLGIDLLDGDDDEDDDEDGFGPGVVSYKRITLGEEASNRVVFVKEELVSDRTLIHDPASVDGQDASKPTTRVRSVFYPSSRQIGENDDRPLPIKLLHVPSAQLRELLSIRDLGRLARTSRLFHLYCRQMLARKQNLVDEPFVFGKTLRYCPAINHLEWTKVSSKFVTDATLSHALRYNLTSLVLSDLDSITNSAFEWMLFEKRQVRLQRLELRNLRLVSSESLCWVSPVELERLVVERCPRVAEEEIVSLFGPNLTALHLKSFQYLTVEGTIDVLARSSLRSLKHLDVSNSRLETNFVGELRVFPLLETLDANYTRVDDEDLERLFGNEERPRKTRIRRLTLNGCEHITDQALEFVPTTIEYLNLSQTIVSDEGM